MSLSFTEIIKTLESFWEEQGCLIIEPLDMEIGAGTSHPATLIKALGKKPWSVAYPQSCRRPKDGRYGENPNRLQQYYQFQVIIKPSPSNIQELYLQSLEKVGIDTKKNDIRFVEDDWENPTLGASGLGWEVWCNGMEITQFTYFQQVGGIELEVVSAEITYGLERIAMYIQNIESVYDIKFSKNNPATYGDIFKENEKQQSAYNLEYANSENLLRHFADYESEAKFMLEKQLYIPAYELCLKANHAFNLLDARGVISVTERASYILRIREIVKQCCELYLRLETSL
ncbi:MAG: glycine--tRNA ligase subunit alpha [Alphaproteobacteria bacterium]|jgi:glycyl-tRNA synthetase alpha chain